MQSCAVAQSVRLLYERQQFPLLNFIDDDNVRRNCRRKYNFSQKFVLTKWNPIME